MKPAPPKLPVHLRRRTITQLLEDFLADLKTENVELGEFMSLLGHRTYGMAMLLFTLPTLLLGSIPGVSTVLTIPVLIVSVQMMMGVERLWMPRRLAKMQFKRSTLANVITKAKPWLSKVEKLVKPRLLFLSERFSKNIIGLFLVIICGVLMLPILFGNWLPSMAIVFIGIGLIERDGVAILLGLAFGVAGTFYATAFFGSIAGLVGAVLP